MDPKVLAFYHKLIELKMFFTTILPIVDAMEDLGKILDNDPKLVNSAMTIRRGIIDILSWINLRISVLKKELGTATIPIDNLNKKLYH